MPITSTIFIGLAAATGAFGVGKNAKALVDNSKASKINKIANSSVETAKENLEAQRDAVSKSLNSLGEIKLNILNSNVMEFVNTFEKLKNVDFTNSVGLEELKNFHIDQNDFKELKELGNFALQVAGSATAGAVGGALTAVGAYSAATTFAAASTGTAISTLSGIAAKNATLAFFGGGAIAQGGGGIALGVQVLGGLVAGPALMVMGLISDAQSQKKLDSALENKAQADEMVETLNTAAYQCSAIRRRCYMFYNLLTHLDSYFLPLIWQMEDIIANEGVDYSQFKEESKKVVAMAASTACSIKAVIDTPILDEDGNLTSQSEEISEKMAQLIYKN